MKTTTVTGLSLLMFLGAAACADAVGVCPLASGAVVSVFATTTRADDFALSLVGKSSLGVEGCATPAVSLVFGPNWLSGCGATAAGGASPPGASGAVDAAIGVPSGRNETVRTGFGLGNSDIVGGADAAGGATSGVLTVEATGVAPEAPAGALAWSPGQGAIAGIASPRRSSAASPFSSAWRRFTWHSCRGRATAWS